MKKKKYTEAQITKIIREANPDLLKVFVLNLCKEQEDVYHKLVEFLQDPLSIKSHIENFESSIIKELENTINDPRSKFELGNWSNILISKKKKEILKRIRTDATNVASRIQLQIKALKIIDQLDSLYQLEKEIQIVKDLVKDFKKIFKEEGEQTRQLLFDACMGYLLDFEELSDEAQLLEIFLWEDYADYNFDNLNKYFKARVDKIYCSQELPAEQKELNLGWYLPTLLSIMTWGKATEEELRNYAKKFWSHPLVRKWFVSYYWDRGELETAMDILEKSIELDQDQPYLIDNYEDMLTELYRLRPNSENYRQRLLKNIKEDRKCTPKAFRELKSLSTLEQWQQALQEIMNSNKVKDEYKVQLLFEENLMDSLAEFVLHRNLNYPIFVEYSSKLPKRYNDAIVNKYEEYFDKMSYQAVNREDYNKIMKVLPDAHSYPGGKEMTERLTRSWLDKFKKRWVLCQKISTFRDKYNFK